MPSRLTSVAAAMLVAGLASAIMHPPAQAQTFETPTGVTCGPRDSVLASLDATLGENTVSRGFTEQGTVLEVLERRALSLQRILLP